MSVSSRQSLAFEPGKDGVDVRFDLILDLSGGRAAVPGPCQARRLLQAGSRQSRRGPARAVRSDRSGRRVREAALRRLPRRSVRPFAQQPDRLHPLPGGLPGGGDPARRRRGRDRPVPLRRLRRLQQRLPDRRRRLRLSADHRAAASGCARCFRPIGRPAARDPVLLVHDEAHGGELISLMSRFGRGLPANVIPFALNEVTQLGLDAILGALAYGAARLLVLVPPKRQDELAGLQAQLGYADAALARPRLRRRTARAAGRGRSRCGRGAAPRARADADARMPAATLPADGRQAGADAARLAGAARACPEPGRPRAAARGRAVRPGRGRHRRAARSASPACRSARPAPWSTIPSGRSSASSRTPACNAACARTPARRA